MWYVLLTLIWCPVGNWCDCCCLYTTIRGQYMIIIRCIVLSCSYWHSYWCMCSSYSLYVDGDLIETDEKSIRYAYWWDDDRIWKRSGKKWQKVRGITLGKRDINNASNRIRTPVLQCDWEADTSNRCAMRTERYNDYFMIIIISI